MQFGILGPLEVWSADGERVPVGGPRPRAMLVMLLSNAGRVVGVEQIIAAVYGDDPPAGAANAVQAQVSRLRRSLGAGLVEFDGTGYRLTAEPEDVDAHRFERLSQEGRRLLTGGNHAKAANLLREAGRPRDRFGRDRDVQRARPDGGDRRCEGARVLRLRLRAARV